MGSITGSGCIVGTSVAAFCAAANAEARVNVKDDVTSEGSLLSASKADIMLGAIAG